MNIKNWLARRRSIEENRIKAAEMDANTLEEQNSDRLRSVMNEIQQQIADAGFIPIKRLSHAKGARYAYSFAVGPDKKVYRVTGYIGGGHDIESIKD